MLSTEYRGKKNMLLFYVLNIIQGAPRFLLINFQVVGCRVLSYCLTKICLEFLSKSFLVNVRFLFLAI